MTTTTTAIVDDHGNTVATGVWTPFNGDDPSVGVAVFDEGDDEQPTPVLMLSPAMAYRLACELMASVEQAQP